MAAVLQSRVPAADAGLRLVDWLARRFAYLDAAGWHGAVAAGAVARNGRRAAADETLAAGDLVAYSPAPARPRDVPVLYADEDVVVIDKPAGLVVQHTSTSPARTFLARLAETFPPGGGAARLAAIHRLDRDTSGVLMVARTPTALRTWSDRFAERRIIKEYLAVVRGSPHRDAFSLDRPIGPATASLVRSRQAVLPTGTPGAKPARTDVEVAARWSGHALLRLRPHTGRTHQLRAHLADAGWPIVHDPLYGQSDASYLAWVADRKASDPTGEVLAPTRQLLHALRLTATGAAPGDCHCWQAPVPADFLAAITASGGPHVADEALRWRGDGHAP